jgi:PAS domain S-box-containing protein
MSEEVPLYNSRLFQTYFDYLHLAHPQVNIRKILDHAQMTAAEVADGAHWFTQQQADRFYEIVAELTADQEIARKAGRFSASSAALGLIHQYVIGLMSTETALLSLAKISPLLTRGAIVEVKSAGPGKIEIISTPTSDAEEKPYQCQNRMGAFEALPKLFTNNYAHIVHPTCLHKGDGACRYIVSWVDPFSLKLRLLRNYTIAGSSILAVIFPLLWPASPFAYFLIFLLCLNGTLSIGHAYQKLKEQERIIESSHVIAEKHIELAHVSYDHSLLIQQIGKATAAILNIDDLMHELATVMHHRLDFDRGLIMLANEKGTDLVYAAGYGYAEAQTDYLQNTSFQLDDPHSNALFFRVFRDRKHMVVTRADQMAAGFCEESRKIIQQLDVHALLCIPIVYKERSLGILAVDNVASKAPLKKSDINLLEGITSQIAISINNARSFQQLEESESRYRQTLESIDEGYFEIGADRAVIFVNKAFGQIVGSLPEQVPGSAFERWFSPESAARLPSLFKQMLESRKPVRFAQLELIDKDDRKLPVDLSASLIEDQNGRATGVRGFLRDATVRLNLEREHKELENQLLRAQKMESIGTLAGGIAHNFNNWLTGILGNVTLIRLDARKQDKVIERALKIEQIIENAAKMNRQLLSYARGGNYEIKPTNLNDLIRESSELFAATRKDITITLELDPDLRTVRVDKNQIEQVFWNLYVNALDAMPDGGCLRIATANATADQLKGRPFEVFAGSHVAVTFTDSGIGIEPHLLENIFEPFFTTKKGKGTGLGLASCYGIIKAHNGFIDVRSRKGIGSVFQIFLPSFSDVPENKLAFDAPIEKGKGTVLVVDDEPMVLETSEELLAGLGYSVLCATSGEEALEIYSDGLDAIDLVIIDMIMPGVSGGELYSRLKRLKPSVKAVLCSGYSMNEMAREIMDRGCDGFLQKPFTLSMLSETIRTILVAGDQAS